MQWQKKRKKGWRKRFCVRQNAGLQQCFNLFGIARVIGWPGLWIEHVLFTELNYERSLMEDFFKAYSGLTKPGHFSGNIRSVKENYLLLRLSLAFDLEEHSLVRSSKRKF